MHVSRMASPPTVLTLRGKPQLDSTSFSEFLDLSGCQRPSLEDTLARSLHRTSNGPFSILYSYYLVQS